jgi:hypothetical protein
MPSMHHVLMEQTRAACERVWPGSQYLEVAQGSVSYKNPVAAMLRAVLAVYPWQLHEEDGGYRVALQIMPWVTRPKWQ